MTRRLYAKPAAIARVVSLSNRYDVSISGTCSVRTENAGTSMSISMPNASRAETVLSGILISEVGRDGAMSTAVFIVQQFLLQFLESLTLATPGARASGGSPWPIQRRRPGSPCPAASERPRRQD